jgi:hypothetical protein
MALIIYKHVNFIAVGNLFQSHGITGTHLINYRLIQCMDHPVMQTDRHIIVSIIIPQLLSSVSFPVLIFVLKLLPFFRH